MLNILVNRYVSLQKSVRTLQKKFRIAVVLFLIGAFPGNAENYYVSNSGNDSNDGKTPETAWKTINKVNNSQFSPGDQILFKRGDTWRGESIELAWAGEASNPIVFGAYGSGDRPVFNGAEIIKTWFPVDGKPNIWVTPSPLNHVSSFRTVVIVDGNRFMPVKSLTNLDTDLEYFVEDSVGSVGDSVYIYSVTDPAKRVTELSTVLYGVVGYATAQSITIKNLEFRYFGYGGVHIKNPQPNGNCLVDNCYFYFNRQVGVQFYNGHNNNTVQNCTATYNGNGFYANLSNNINFINNTVSNTISYDVKVTDGHGIGCYQADNVLIEGNTMELNQGCNIGYSIATDSTTSNNGIIRYNTLKANTLGYGHVLGANNVRAGSTLDIYNNLVLCDQDNNYSIKCNNSLGGRINFYNNTIVHSGDVSYVIRFNYADSITFKNNIIFNTSTGATDGLLWIYYEGTPDSDNNIWYDENSVRQFAQRPGVVNYPLLSDWQAASSRDLNSNESDPLFAAELRDLNLRNGSPAINNGTDVGLIKDILGNPIVEKPDIGAYESDVKDTDTERPVVTEFTVPDTSSSLVVAVNSFTATDNKSVTKFIITESATAPAGDDAGWSTDAPTSYTFSTKGTKTLYAYAKDAAGNISASTSDKVFIAIPEVYTTEEISICEGESYEGWTESGQYERTLIAASGADSIVNTNLTVIPVNYVAEDISIPEGESYNGWSESGVYERTLTAATGCDSIVTTNLTVILNIITTEEISICEGESYEGWTTSGLYERILTAASGADSIVTTQLTVHPVYEFTEEVTIKSGESYEGWTESGQYQRTLSTVSGCDSVVTTNLTVLEKIYTTEAIEICDGESYEGWTESGQYERTLESTIGADSVVTTNLTVYPAYDMTEEIAIKEGESYEGWTEPGQYERTLIASTGCDSVVTTNLTVVPFQTQTIPLEKGWNTFSSFLIPEDRNMEVVLAELLQQNQYLLAEDEEGNTLEKNGNHLTNSLPGYKSTEGYKINVEHAGELTITGHPAELPHDIPLKKGWNIISFPVNGAVDAITVLQPLMDAGTLVKVQDEQGNAIEYWGDEMGWINGIGNFEPGEGYLVQVSRDETLTIHANYEKTGHLLSASLPPDYFTVDFEGNGSGHMNINIGNLAQSGLRVDDEIAAYDGGICVGAVKLSENTISNNAVSIAASLSDKNRANGFTEGNPVEIRVWQWNKSAAINALSETTKGNMIYQRHESVFVNVINTGTTGKTEITSAVDMKLYPNPASDKVMLEFTRQPQPGTQVILTDLTGKQLMIHDAQSMVETINVQPFPSGIYLVKTDNGESYNVKKLIIN